jgi:hypothetical protein
MYPLVVILGLAAWRDDGTRDIGRCRPATHSANNETGDKKARHLVTADRATGIGWLFCFHSVCFSAC